MNGPASGTTIVTALPLAEEEGFLEGARRHGAQVLARCPGAAQLVEAVGAQRPDWVAVVARPQYLDARVLGACDALGVRVLVGVGGSEEQRYARSLGLSEWHARPLQWPGEEGPERPVAGIAGTTPELAAPPPRARVTVVWGTDGAPGRSSIAVNLAAEFVRAGERVALADADTRAASLALALGLLDEAPGFAAACRLAGLGSLSNAELDRLADDFPADRGSLRVLTGIVRASRWTELGADRVAAVIEQSRGWVDRLVVDTAASAEPGEELVPGLAAVGRDDATIGALRSADDIVLVGAGDPVGAARVIRSYSALLELVDEPRVTVVINKVRSSVLGLAPEQQLRESLERFADIRSPVFIDWDPAAFDAALLRARPVAEVAPRSAAAAQLRALAAERLGAAALGPTVVRRKPRGARRSASALA